LRGQGGLKQTHLGSHGVVKKKQVPVGSVRESWEGLQGPAGYELGGRVHWRPSHYP